MNPNKKDKNTFVGNDMSLSWSDIKHRIDDT